MALTSMFSYPFVASAPLNVGKQVSPEAHALLVDGLPGCCLFQCVNLPQIGFQGELILQSWLVRLAHRCIRVVIAGLSGDGFGVDGAMEFDRALRCNSTASAFH